MRRDKVVPKVDRMLLRIDRGLHSSTRDKSIDKSFTMLKNIQVFDDIPGAESAVSIDNRVPPSRRDNDFVPIVPVLMFPNDNYRQHG